MGENYNSLAKRSRIGHEERTVVNAEGVKAQVQMMVDTAIGDSDDDDDNFLSSYARGVNISTGDVEVSGSQESRKTDSQASGSKRHGIRRRGGRKGKAAKKILKTPTKVGGRQVGGSRGAGGGSAGSPSDIRSKKELQASELVVIEARNLSGILMRRMERRSPVVRYPSTQAERTRTMLLTYSSVPLFCTVALPPPVPRLMPLSPRPWRPLPPQTAKPLHGPERLSLEVLQTRPLLRPGRARVAAALVGETSSTSSPTEAPLHRRRYPTLPSDGGGAKHTVTIDGPSQSSPNSLTALDRDIDETPGCFIRCKLPEAGYSELQWGDLASSIGFWTHGIRHLRVSRSIVGKLMDTFEKCLKGGRRGCLLSTRRLRSVGSARHRAPHPSI